MIITTTDHIAGKEIVEYKGIVSGETILGINIIRDFGAGVKNFFGGRAEKYEEELVSAREMENRALKMGATAVVGVKMDYEMLGTNNGMIMVSCSGTAVLIR